LTTCTGFWTVAGAATGALIGGIGGGGAGALVAAPTGEAAAVVTVPALSAAGVLKGGAIGATIGAGLDVLMSKHVGRMNREIRTDRAPDGVKRVDKGKVSGEQDHVHFRDGSALNEDGSWKHGGTELTRAIEKWLSKWGWNLPQ
jgi:hypothetical protein